MYLQLFSHALTSAHAIRVRRAAPQGHHFTSPAAARTGKIRVRVRRQSLNAGGSRAADSGVVRFPQ